MKATVIYIKDGRGEGACSEGYEVDLKKVNNKFSDKELSHSKEIPAINAASSDSKLMGFRDFRHVAIHVKDDGFIGRFDKPGFYIIMGVTPSEFEEKMP